MPEKFTDGLSGLIGAFVTVSAFDGYSGHGAAPIRLAFSHGTNLEAVYWRLTGGGKEVVSSFDHQQRYGLPAPIDAIRELQNTLRDKTVLEAGHDEETGDLLFQFTGDIKLQVFGFSGYEVWEISFSDGTGEYSNYAKR